MEEDNWTAIPGYPNYQINREGLVKAIKRGKRGQIKPSNRYTLYTGGSLSGKQFSRSALLKLCFGDDYIKPARTELSRPNRRGASNPNSKYLFVINGKKHDSIASATKHYNELTKSNTSQRTVRRNCMKKREFCYFLPK